MNVSKKPQLSFSTASTQLSGLLRADAIRRNTLLSLATAWADDESREQLEAQLDALADAMRSPREGELDALLENVEDAAAMDDAHTELPMADLLRLRDELNAVIAETAGRFNPTLVPPLPQQHERRTA